jgi:hypothetical protein
LGIMLSVNLVLPIPARLLASVSNMFVIDRSNHCH